MGQIAYEPGGSLNTRCPQQGQGNAATGQTREPWQRFYARAGNTDWIAATTSSARGGVWGRKRATTSPSGDTRNFSKFQRISPVCPSASGVVTRRVYNGCRPPPFTSTFSVMGNETPYVFEQNVAICSAVP